MIRRLHSYTVSKEYSVKVAKRIQKLMQLLAKRFKYWVDEDEEEDKPAVVEESENYF